MEDSAAVASRLFEQFRELICQGFNDQQIATARNQVIKWLAARIEDYRDRSPEEQRRLVEVYIPNEINEKFAGQDRRARFDQAATAFDQWRLQVLNRRVLDRANAFLEQRGNPQEMKAEAEPDLQELQAIEARLMQEFQEIYRTYRTIISESKLDSFYVLRDGGFVSRRLGRQIQRMKRR